MRPRLIDRTTQDYSTRLGPLHFHMMANKFFPVLTDRRKFVFTQGTGVTANDRKRLTSLVPKHKNQNQIPLLLWSLALAFSSPVSPSSLTFPFSFLTLFHLPLSSSPLLPPSLPARTLAAYLGTLKLGIEGYPGEDSGLQRREERGEMGRTFLTFVGTDGQPQPLGPADLQSSLRPSELYTKASHSETTRQEKEVEIDN